MKARARRRIVAFFAFVCALGCLHAQARAQAPEAEAQGAENAEYKELIEQALSEFRHKNWPEARVLFRRAHEISPNARTLRGMGIVSYEMRDYVQAVRDLSAALADTRQPLTEQQRTECQTLLTRSRTFVGVFDVRVTPAEADLRVDGAPITREPDGSVVLDFGEHTLTASAAGHVGASARVAVQGGERRGIELRLLPETAAAVATAPGAEETPQGTKAGNAPPSEPERGFRGGGLRYTWVALAVSAVFGGGAAAAYYVGDKELDDLDAQCERQAQEGHPCTKESVDTDSVMRYQRLTNAALGVSGAALLAAVVVGYFEWPRERSVSVSLGPTSLMLRREF